MTATVFAGDEFLVAGGTIRVRHTRDGRLRIFVAPDGGDPCPMRVPYRSPVEVLDGVWLEWFGLRRVPSGRRVPLVRVTSHEQVAYRPCRAA